MTMTKATIRALMKGLQKKAQEDGQNLKAFEDTDELTTVLAEVEGNEPRIRLPYVNATPIGSDSWN